MIENAEMIDSSRMKVLSEFPLEYGKDEEITKAESAFGTKLYLGILKNDVINKIYCLLQKVLTNY